MLGGVPGDMKDFTRYIKKSHEQWRNVYYGKYNK